MNEMEISERDRAALLKEGVVVLSVEERAGRRTVNIAGRDQECATPMVTALLGNDVDVMGWGYGRRCCGRVAVSATWSVSRAACSCAT